MTRTLDRLHHTILVKLAIARHAAWHDFATFCQKRTQHLDAFEINRVLFAHAKSAGSFSCDKPFQWLFSGILASVTTVTPVISFVSSKHDSSLLQRP
jgi:hypothetical protein